MAQKKNAVIVGGGTSKFGVRQAHLLDMIQEAARACANDIPGLKPTDIDGLIIATTMAGRHSSALNTAPLVVHRLGLTAHLDLYPAGYALRRLQLGDYRRQRA